MQDDRPTLDAPEVARAPRARAGQLEGLVIALAPGLFEVAVDQHVYLCTLRGKLRKHRPPATATAPTSRQPAQLRGGQRSLAHQASAARTAASATVETPDAPPQRVAPGDRVLMTPLSATEGVIEAVQPRRSVMRRMRSEAGSEHIMLANLDLAGLVFATRDPEPNLGLLDRYLAICEHDHISAVICFNKVDLGISAFVADAAALYSSLGYPILFTSVASGAGVVELQLRLAGRIALLTGPSGVGKSSLTNMLVPGATQRIGDVNQTTGKGKHTTTGVRLLALADGGWLADSAGIRELALWNVPAADLAETFVELRPYLDHCAFEDCTHGPHEAGCALRGALEAGAIAPSRWVSFERLLADARAAEPALWEA